MKGFGRKDIPFVGQDVAKTLNMIKNFKKNMDNIGG